MSFNMNILAHARAIQNCLPQFEARADLNFTTFHLEVRARGRYYDLIPQYSIVKDGRTRYVPVLVPEVTHFIGWNHYFNRQWRLSSDKLAFKRYCVTNGLRVPGLFATTREIAADFIIKKARSSFGEGIKGPFRRSDAASMNPMLMPGEYFEQFVPGQIAKVWYWQETPVCLEIKGMPAVTGDGKRSLRQLISTSKTSATRVDWASIEAVARFQGLSPDSILPKDYSAMVDFRYMSGLTPINLENSNIIGRYRETELFGQLERAGPIFWRGIPEDICQGTLFTIDAIIDQEQRAWFLEMNSNPVIHPDIYLPMFEGLFGAVERASPPQAVTPRPPAYPPARVVAFARGSGA